LITTTENIEAEATVGIIGIPDGTCCRIDDTPQFDKVLYGGCGDGGGDQDHTRDEHRAEQ